MLHVCGQLIGPVPTGGHAYVLTGIFLDAATAASWVRFTQANFLGTVELGTVLPGLGEVGVANVRHQQEAA